MIAYLKGKIIIKESNFVVINVSGVGYKVFFNESAVFDFKINDIIECYTYQHIKEDSLDLYGFFSFEDLKFFELLLSVSGVGPKSALSVLSIADTNELKASISANDTSLLTKASGIGRKTAERVVLELKEKIDILSLGDVGGVGSDSEAQGVGQEIEALVSLGYSVQQARDALRKVNPELKDSGERIKEALKNI